MSDHAGGGSDDRLRNDWDASSIPSKRAHRPGRNILTTNDSIRAQLLELVTYLLPRAPNILFFCLVLALESGRVHRRDVVEGVSHVEE